MNPSVLTYSQGEYTKNFGKTKDKGDKKGQRIKSLSFFHSHGTATQVRIVILRRKIPVDVQVTVRREVGVDHLTVAPRPEQSRPRITLI